jgi:hypothetical protein
LAASGSMLVAANSRALRLSWLGENVIMLFMISSILWILIKAVVYINLKVKINSAFNVIRNKKPSKYYFKRIFNLYN